MELHLPFSVNVQNTYMHTEQLHYKQLREILPFGWGKPCENLWQTLEALKGAVSRRKNKFRSKMVQSVVVWNSIDRLNL